MTTFQNIVYTALFAIYSYALWWDIWYIAVALNPSVAGLTGVWTRLCFLTFWNLGFQSLYFGGIFLGIFKATLSKQLRHYHVNNPSNFRLYISRGIIGPYGVFVSAFFWAIFIVDRELIFPSELDKFIPSWWNHAAHTLPFVSTLIDRFFCDMNNHAKARKYRPFLLTLFVGLCYLCWLLFLGLSRGFWVYPIFEMLDIRGRALLVLGAAAVLLASFYTSDRLSLMFWPHQALQPSSQPAKKPKRR